MSIHYQKRGRLCGQRMNLRASDVPSPPVLNPISLSVSPKPTNAVIGDTVQFIATVTYDDASTVDSIDDNTLVSFSSSDPVVASIDATTGNSEALAAGDATIHAELKSDTSIFDDVDLTVSEVPTNLNEFSIVVGERAGSRPLYGVDLTISDDFIGSFSSDSWDSDENATKAKLAARTYSTTGDNEVAFYSSNKSQWSGWAGMTITFTDDNREIDLTFDSPLSGQYSNRNDSEATSILNYLSDKVGETLNIKLSESTLIKLK